MNRRIVALLLAVVMLLSLAACKKQKPSDETTVPVEVIAGVEEVPDDFWEELTPAEQETEETKETAATEETEATQETTATDPTDGNSPTEETKAPAATEDPKENQDATTEATEPSAPEYSDTKLSQYEWYQELSGEEQVAYMNSFDSVADFFAWYNAAKDEYEKQNPSVEIGGGSIDLGDIIGGKG